MGDDSLDMGSTAWTWAGDNLDMGRDRGQPGHGQGQGTAWTCMGRDRGQPGHAWVPGRDRGQPGHGQHGLDMDSIHSH